MNKKHEQIFQVAELAQVAQAIMNGCQHTAVITLSGTLGAGKTTLAIEMLRQWGITDEMQSPTYTYMQAYKNKEGQQFYHFDLYRLQDKEAFLFAGFDEFLYQKNSIVLIEWPDIIQDLLKNDVCNIQLTYVDDATRKISWNYK